MSANALVMYRAEAAALPVQPSNGMDLLVLGRLTDYPVRGALQFVASEIRLGDGRGLDALATEQLMGN